MSRQGSLDDSGSGIGDGDAQGGRAVSELAEAVVDGSEIDWRSAERAAGTDELPVVRALREVETVLGAHREVLAEESPKRRRPPPLQPGDSWSHLEIRSCLGRGGFGDVYEAFDPKLARATALKLVYAPEASDEALLREAQMLAKVNHPNVVRVYGADRVDAQVGISMELLEGHTLSDELDRFGPMGADDAVVIGLKLCDALAEVHRQGIVHRDVKAQNVMRARGRVVLMDFGIGLDESSGESARPAGTPAYLAPELLAGGESAVRPGVKTDVYALGVLLFHLVTADFPVRGRSLTEFRERHKSGAVRHLTDVRPGLPDAFVEVVEKALAADPSQRFATAGALHRALSRAMATTVLGTPPAVPGRRRAAFFRGAGLTAAVLLVAAVLWWQLAAPNWSPPAEETRVLLDDVEDRSGDAAFSGSIDLLLRSAVRDSPAFEPVSKLEERDLARRMLREPDEPCEDARLQEAAIRAGAPAVLTGQLLEVGGGWELALWLSPTLDSAAHRSAQTVLPNLTMAGLESAFDEVLTELGAATEDWRKPGGAMDPEELPQLETATTSSLDALRAFTHGLRSYEAGEIEASEAEFRAAIQADPDFALANLHLGHSLSAKGDQESALFHFQRAFDLRHRTASDLERLTIEGAYRAVFRQYRKAIEAYEQVLHLVDSDPSIRRQLAIAWLELGQHDKAIANARLGRDESLNHGLLVYVLAASGRPEEALEEAAGIRSSFGVTPYLQWSEGLALLGLERIDEALLRTREMKEGMTGVYRNLASWLEARIHLFVGDLDTASRVLYRDRRIDAVEGTDFLEIRRRYWTARIQAIRGQRSNALGVLRALDMETIPAHLTGWRAVAVLQAELGDFEGAETTLARLESIHAGNPSLISAMVTSQVRAEILLAQDEPEHAVDALRPGGDLSDVSFVRTSSRVYAALGEFEESAFLDDRLLERRGELLDKAFVGFWVEAHVRRARTSELLGRRQDAAEHWAAARKYWGDLADEAFGAGAPADALPWLLP